MKDLLELEKLAPANVTDGREARPNLWVAILVQTNCERRVSEKLNSRNFESYVATQEELHRWSDRIKKIQRLVIPNIVFVRAEKSRFEELKRFSFVRGLLSNPGEKEPAIIPDKQIDMLQFMLGQTDVPVLVDNNVRQLNLGGRIRVIRGTFRGFEGTICRLREGDLHVGILLNGLGFAHVQINKNDIQEI